MANTIPASRRRKILSISLAPEVIAAVNARARRDDLPVSRVINTLLQRVLEVPAAPLETGRAA